MVDTDIGGNEDDEKKRMALAGVTNDLNNERMIPNKFSRTMTRQKWQFLLVSLYEAILKPISIHLCIIIITNKFSRTMTRQRWQLLLVSPADNVGGVKNRETGDEQLSEECLMRVIIIILVVTIIFITFIITIITINIIIVIIIKIIITTTTVIIIR